MTQRTKTSEQSLFFSLIAAIFILLTSCSLQRAVYKPAPSSGSTIPFPATRFLVFTDPHVFHPDLGIGQPAFLAYTKQEPKLIAKSAEIFASLTDKLRSEPADFVIICGDLTKDGEKASHQLVVRYLEELEASNKSVFVIPGNHDIRNTRAHRYIGNKTEPTETLTPTGFAELYARFGYQEALYRDPASLSYLAEPVTGLWLLALDSCGYNENPGTVPGPIATGGAFSSDTILWLREMLSKARQANKAVIACMHHGLLKHYNGQERYYKEFIVDKYQQLSRLLASYHVPLVFTGHYHAQDIVVKHWQERERKTFLFDVMTGSPVNYPSPYRLVQINANQQVEIKSKYLTSIESYPDQFLTCLYIHQYQYILRLVYRVLTKYKVDTKSAYRLAKQLALIAMANFKGDERITEPLLNYRGVGLWGRIVAGARKSLFRGMSQDLEPADNDLILNLNSY